jgi:hypothetical protein
LNWREEGYFCASCLLVSIFYVDKVHVLFYGEVQEKIRRMDWNRAIEINRVALTRIVGELFAMLGVVSGLTLGRVLRPAESALRRLIVIAAHGLVAKPIASRPMPKALVIASKSTGRKSFQLFDTRKVFGKKRGRYPLFDEVSGWAGSLGGKGVIFARSIR